MNTVVLAHAYLFLICNLQKHVIASVRKQCNRAINDSKISSLSPMEIRYFYIRLVIVAISKYLYSSSKFQQLIDLSLDPDINKKYISITDCIRFFKC